MRDLKNNLITSGKGSKNTQSRKGKSFGYQILGFGSGVSGGVPVSVDYMVVAGGGGGGYAASGGGGAGGYRASGYGPSPLQGSALAITTGCY